MHMPASATPPPPKRKTTKSDKQFPGKLYDLLSYAEQEGQGDIICWVRDGRAFAVHDADRLVNELLPLFFGQTKYRSFRRQLNMWSFERVLGSPHKGVFTHPYFVRGQKERCKEMCRHDFQVVGQRSMQMAQDSIIREVYSNAPMLASSPGNIANLRQDTTPSSPGYVAHELPYARRPSLPAILPFSVQKARTLSNDAMQMPLRSSASAPPSLASPLELHQQNTNSHHELRTSPTSPTSSLSGKLSIPDQINIVHDGCQSIQLNSASNVPMMLEPVQLSFYQNGFGSNAPKNVDLCNSHRLLQGAQEGVFQELCNDSSDDKKMPAKSEGKTEGNAQGVIELSAGNAMVFEGRQFFLVDSSSSSDEEAVLRAGGVASSVELYRSSGSEIEFRSSEASETGKATGIAAAPIVTSSETRFSSKTASRGPQNDTEGQNQLLRQFAQWKAHGPPDENVGEDEFDHLFD